MQHVRDLPVRRKLHLSFGSLAVLLAVVIGIAIRAMGDLGASDRRVTRQVVPQVIAADMTMSAALNMHFSQTASSAQEIASSARELGDGDAAPGARRPVHARRVARRPRDRNGAVDHLERFREMMAGVRPRPPVSELIGIRMTHAERGRVVFELDAGPQHASPLGTVHGGILCDLADAALGCAHASQLEEGESFTTLELKINFLKPVWEGHLVAEATLVKAGRTVGLAECRITDEHGSLVAFATSTLLTLRDEMAQGR